MNLEGIFFRKKISIYLECNSHTHEQLFLNLHLMFFSALSWTKPCFAIWFQQQFLLKVLQLSNICLVIEKAQCREEKKVSFIEHLLKKEGSIIKICLRLLVDLPAPEKRMGHKQDLGHIATKLLILFSFNFHFNYI